MIKDYEKEEPTRILHSVYYGGILRAMAGGHTSDNMKSLLKFTEEVLQESQRRGMNSHCCGIIELHRWSSGPESLGVNIEKFFSDMKVIKSSYDWMHPQKEGLAKQLQIALVKSCKSNHHPYDQDHDGQFSSFLKGIGFKEVSHFKNISGGNEIQTLAIVIDSSELERILSLNLLTPKKIDL